MVMEYEVEDQNRSYTFIQNARIASRRSYDDVARIVTETESAQTSYWIEKSFERQMIANLGVGTLAVVGPFIVASAANSLTNSIVAGAVGLVGAGYVAFKGLMRSAAWADEAETRYQNLMDARSAGRVDPHVVASVKHQLGLS